MSATTANGWIAGSSAVDDVTRLLEDSMDAIHRENTRRPIRCMCGCGLIFMTAREYFRHAHPSAGRR